MAAAVMALAVVALVVVGIGVAIVAIPRYQVRDVTVEGQDESAKKPHSLTRTDAPLFKSSGSWGVFVVGDAMKIEL